MCELPIENNAVKLSIPNTVAPQYSKPPNDCAEKTAADEVCFGFIVGIRFWSKVVTRINSFLLCFSGAHVRFKIVHTGFHNSYQEVADLTAKFFIIVLKVLLFASYEFISACGLGESS